MLRIPRGPATQPLEKKVPAPPVWRTSGKEEVPPFSHSFACCNFGICPKFVLNKEARLTPSCVWSQVYS